MLLWPYVVLKVCLVSALGTCHTEHLPVNIEDRGLLAPEAVELTCQMTFFRTAFVWGQEHPHYKVMKSGCMMLDPEAIPRPL